MHGYNDHNTTPADPWTEWDDYANSWVCRICGATAGFGVHSRRCKYNLTCIHGCPACEECKTAERRLSPKRQEKEKP